MSGGECQTTNRGDYDEVRAVMVMIVVVILIVIVMEVAIERMSIS